MTCMILLTIAFVFTSMAVYIKVTYYTGYRAAKATKASQGWFGGMLGGLWGGHDEL